MGYFFRRIFTIISKSGFQALISTNTIAQGGTREGSLDIITANKGTINFAMRSVRWPGEAAVNVSLVAVYRGDWNGRRSLDGKTVPYISTYLDDAKTIGDPFPLAANRGKSFQGSIVLGKGFILTPEEAVKLIEKDPKNKEVIFPYLNGDDLNSRPDQSPSRYVINFFDWPIEKAMEYEDCFKIVEEKVKPERTRWKKDKNGNDIVGEFALRTPLPQKWWIYADKRPALYQTIAGMERVLVVALTTKHLSFTFCSNGWVFSHATGVVAESTPCTLAILSGSAHHEWARRYCSSLETRLRYIPSVVFEIYPFPCSTNPQLAKAGAAYGSERTSIVNGLGIGLTKLYNLFHTPDLTIEQIANVSHQLPDTCEQYLPGILCLRDLHRDIDQAVLAAYGWSDINLAHDFYEVDYLPENDRIRYTISPEARKEVLFRLLELNHKRHAEEVAAGLVNDKGKLLKKKPARKIAKNARKTRSKVAAAREDSPNYDLFGPAKSTRAVLFVEGPTDKFYIETAAKTCNRMDLLEGILIEAATGAKQARELAIQYRNTHGNTYELRALFDWDDSGKDAYSKLKADPQWGKRKVWTYRKWKEVEPSTVPVEAEDMFENGLLEAFIQKCGETVVTEKQKFKDGTFHYGIEQNQKKSLEYWIEHNAKPEHCGRWILLLQDLRKSVGFG